MTTMTKKFTATYNKSLWQNTLGRIIRNQKITALINEGKTSATSTALVISQFDGTADSIVSIVGSRGFVDQAAAEDWRDFCVEFSAEYSLGLISTAIEDV